MFYNSTVIPYYIQRPGAAGALGLEPSPSPWGLQCQHLAASIPPPPSPVQASGAGNRGLTGAWELPMAPTTPLTCTGDPGYPACPRGPSRPGGGGSGVVSPLCHRHSTPHEPKAQLASGEWLSS